MAHVYWVIKSMYSESSITDGSFAALSLSLVLIFVICFPRTRSLVSLSLFPSRVRHYSVLMYSLGQNSGTHSTSPLRGTGALSIALSSSRSVAKSKHFTVPRLSPYSEIILVHLKGILGRPLLLVCARIGTGSSSISSSRLYCLYSPSFLASSSISSIYYDSTAVGMAIFFYF